MSNFSPLYDAKSREAMGIDICPVTKNGWTWYCDHHDTHGQADACSEAIAYVMAHWGFWQSEECEALIQHWANGVEIGDDRVVLHPPDQISSGDVAADPE